SVWRPINHPAEDNTLTLCDGSAIDDSDVVEADHITRQYLESTMYGLFSRKHKWYYLSKQTPEELYFFKIFESDPGGVRCLERLF
ncbi:uncharacterized protein BDZ99DRAFT_402741, partial [Mytilinidion resinicola]